GGLQAPAGAGAGGALAPRARWPCSPLPLRSRAALGRGRATPAVPRGLGEHPRSAGGVPGGRRRQALSQRKDDPVPDPSRPENVALVVRRTIRAPVERVFDAWTRPEHLRRWWGPKPVRCTEAEVDLRRGGRYRIANQHPDGK